MEKDQSTISDQILNLTLEIIYLLTGEDYILVKKPRGRTQNNRLQVVEGICRSWGNVLLEQRLTPEEDNAPRILELTNKVIQLLMGEVPIRCQDVAVYFSMEEWEYVEGHKDLYPDIMEDPRPRTSQDNPISNSPPHNAPSYLVNEDDVAMDTNSETESLDTQDPRERQKISSEAITEEAAGYENGHLSDGDDPPHYSCIRIKEEPCEDSWDGEDLLDTSAHSTGQLHIKEEPSSYDEEDLIDAIVYNPPDHTQHHPYPHIMEECGGQSPTQLHLYPSTGPSRYPPIREDEDRASCDLTDPPTDHTQQQHHPYPHIMEESVTCGGQSPTQLHLCPSTGPSLYPPIHEDEDRSSCDLTDPPTDHTQQQHHPYPHITEESVTCGGQSPTQLHLFPSTGPSRYPPIHEDEERATFDLTDPPIDHTQQHHVAHNTEEPALSNKDHHNDTALPTQFVPIRTKKKPDRVLSKIQRYPTRRSTSGLVKHREPTSHNRRKGKNLESSVMEPLAASDSSGRPRTDNNIEKDNSSSVYSVRQGADTVEILYHCPSCHKGFSSNLELARHQVIHTVDKVFICSLCGKSFTELSFLVKHQVIHTDLKLCVCPVCGGCFYSETSLAKHQKSHSLPSFCNTCGQCFFNKTELEVHERKHLGKRPFTCHLCGKHFLAKSVLNKHLLTHAEVGLPK